MDKDLQSIQEARDLIESAHSAWKQFESFSEEQVERILLAISKAGVAGAASLARLANEETGYGTVEHKTAKNLFCADNVYRAIQPLKTIGIVNEDRERKVMEIASPLGVIAAIVPSTNPTSTTIYKALIALKGRNAIVFSPHPSAVRCINETARLITEGAETAGMPHGVICCMKAPTLEGTNELMKHPKTALILATGGMGLVKAAYSAGKPAYGVGPGNVPAYIEKTADVHKAVSDILTGKTFDNGTLCSSEQSLICDDVLRDQVLAELKSQRAYICNPQEKTLLEKTIQTPRRTLNTRIVGQSAPRIAQMAGFQVPPDTRALVGFADGVGPDHPLSMEKLSPVLAFYAVKDWREGCELCIRILSFGGLGHSLGLHTRDQEIVKQFGLQKPAFRICVNTNVALGAVGLTTNLFPSMTLGCGSLGGNITSDNISPLHLINLKRVAYGVREVEPSQASRAAAVSSAIASPARSTIEHVVDRWLGHRSADAAHVEPVAPPLESFKELEPGKPEKPKEASVAPEKAVAFVCEDDVRKAMASHSRIPVGKKTIVTPSARELGDTGDVFKLVD